MISVQRLWPLGLAVLVTFLNTDLIVIPALKLKGYSHTEIFFLVALIANLELTFWYWFWGWVVRWVKETRQVKASVVLGQEVGRELKRRGHIDRIMAHVEGVYMSAISPDNHVGRKIKRWGWWGLLILASEPMPAGRVVGAIICGTTRWKTGLLALLLGNLIHIATVLLGLEFISWLFR